MNTEPLEHFIFCVRHESLCEYGRGQHSHQCFFFFFCHVLQSPPLPRALNDSGCPLGDTDLFDTGLGEEEDEEESLEAIRAAVKQKMKKRKVNFFRVCTAK